MRTKARLQMSKINKALEKYLKKACENVYLAEAPADTPIPYIIYDTDRIKSMRFQQLIYLDVDIWDRNSLITRVESILKKLKELDGLSHIDKDVQFTLYLDGIQVEPEKFPGWIHYIATFELRLIERT